jgi:hypothetical protein
MDFNRDEVRREIRDIDATNRAVMTRWRSALQELINPDSKLSTDEKHALLGVPSRRGFFKIGGVTLLGATVLAACGDDDEDVAESGTAPTTAAGGEGGEEAPAEGNLDLTLAKTAASVENLAVAAYQTAIDSGIVTDATIGAAAAAFRDHHQAHADAINGVVTGAGAEAVTDPNQVLFDALVQPVLDAGPTQDSLVQLAYDLETAAVQAYAFAGGNLSTPGLRSTIMTIGGVESRHAAVLKMLAQGDPGPGVFYDGAFISAAEVGIPDEALIS